jgi:Fur family ferric uptake transcriptional regulator
MERNTRQRTAIKDALESAARPLLPQEVLTLAQDAAPGVSLATVYRNLKSLVQEGEVQPVNLPGESTRFERSHGHHHHHHHFQCRSCQSVFDIHACPGELTQLAPKGFVVQDHDLTLYGFCDRCAHQDRPGSKHTHA